MSGSRDPTNAAKDLKFKIQVLDGIIVECRKKCWFFGVFAASIIVGSLALIVLGMTTTSTLPTLINQIGGTPVASTLIAGVGSIPTLRECMEQWSAIRGLEDLKRGYLSNPSKAMLEKLDQVFVERFAKRAGAG